VHTETVQIKRVLISVSDKTGIADFAAGLSSRGAAVLSTGGTAKLLRDRGIPVEDVSSYTGFPEMMDGRVKTLHPLVHGAILGLRDRHAADAQKAGIKWIDMVVCSLYPFERTVENPETDLEQALENIDIGGPSMIRSAAKNAGWTTAVTSAADYGRILAELDACGGITYETRLSLSAAAFRHTAQYDALIQQYLTDEKFPRELTLTYRKYSSLRYGENPHQEAAAYRAVLPPRQRDTMSLYDAEVLNGKELSYNNINDAEGALETLREFDGPACVVVKHANPCGAASAPSVEEAVQKAFDADRMSAFGGIVAMNRSCTEKIAAFFRSVFIEIIIAPDYTPQALELLRRKKNLRVLQTGSVTPLTPRISVKGVGDGILVQDRDAGIITAGDLRTVTERTPDDGEIEDMLFAWKVLKHVKSNGILTAKEKTTLGIGPGQVSRVDAVATALRKTGTVQGAVLASDAFFPFRDSIDALAGSGITAVIQPGGSVRDEEVIAACNELGIAMVFTGVRCFSHG
jgi:phosphoribosylaminoimidazolecarboxamide formyltransferase / IMP cyclohydrolase